MVGSPTFTIDQKGQANKAMSFNGTNYSSIAHSSSLNIANSITIAYWIKPSSTTGLAYLVGKGAILFSRIYSEKIEFGVHRFTGWQVITSVSSVSINTWYHIALVYNGANMLIYIDSVQEPSRALSGTIDTSNSTLYIGTNPWAPAEDRYSGSLADVRIYNRALSASEVKALYELYE